MYTFKVLVQEQLSTTPVVLYTVPAEKTNVVKTISICNTDTLDHTVSLWTVASGDSESTKNKILHNLLVLAGETAFISPDHYLSAGYKIVMSSDSTALGVTITGVEV